MGAEAMIPAIQSAFFFHAIGSLVTGLLIGGRVGAGIGAELANMRVTEQMAAIESLSIDSIHATVDNTDEMVTNADEIATSRSRSLLVAHYLEPRLPCAPLQSGVGLLL
jgi:hypothetical protein